MADKSSLHSTNYYSIALLYYDRLVLADPTLWGGAYGLEIISSPSEEGLVKSPYLFLCEISTLVSDNWCLITTQQMTI